MKFHFSDSGKQRAPQNAWLADALDTVSVAVVYTDAYGEILRINEQAQKNLRIPPEVFLSGKKLSEVLSVRHGPQDMISEALARLTRKEECGKLPSWTYIRMTGTDVKFYIEGQFVGLYGENEELQEVLFLFRNIEDELTREFILDMAMGRTKIFPWFYDLDNNRMLINEWWFSHLGLPVGDCTISAEEFFGMVHPDDRDVLADAFAQQLSGNLIPDLFQYRLRRGDGSWEWFEVQSVYLGRVDDGLPYRLVGICQSIHAHKTVEETLRAARDKAQESDRLKSAFLANMSHEIRTPLNAIMGFSGLLVNEELEIEEEDRKEYGRLITANGDQLLALISDILDLSKIESNTLEFSFAEIPLDALLTDIYQAQKMNMHPGVELVLDLPGEETPVETDIQRLKQVMNNLINNAVKFTEKGNITFGYRAAPEKYGVELFVRDTGKGISPENVARIFDRFYKADSFEKGVGLGLAISQTIIDYLGGSVSVSSEEGKGTVFTVFHPLRQKRR